MKTLAKVFTHSLAAAGLSAALVAPALAGNPFEDNAPRRTVEVRTSDLDLGTAAGQRMLDTRIENAIRQVCRTVSIQAGTRILDQSTQECKANARAEAKQKVAALMDRAQRGG